MTRTISLVAIVALAGLALVPTALGNHQYGDAVAGTPPVDFWNYDPQTGAEIANTSPGVAPQDIAALHAAAWAESPDVFERAVRSQQQSQPAGNRPLLGRDPWLAQEQRDLAQAPRTLAAPTPATGSSDELEWLQIGIGLAAGILLAFGLVLSLRMVRIRPLAH